MGVQAGSAVPDVYINNRKLVGVVERDGRDLLVELEAAARAIRIAVTRDGQGRFSAGGRALSTTRVSKGRRAGVPMVSLRELAAVAGARVMEQPGLGIVDVITFDPAARARELGARKDGPSQGASPRRPGVIEGKRVTDVAYVEYLYGICTHHLATVLGMRIQVPITKRFVSVDEVQTEAGSRSVWAFARKLTLPDRDVYELWVPVGLPADRTTHLMTHELSHVWQWESRVQFGTSQLVEGFCEWTASTLLQDLGFTQELGDIEKNLSWDYSEGYRYICDMARKLGPVGTVEHFRNSEWKGHR